MVIHIKARNRPGTSHKRLTVLVSPTISGGSIMSEPLPEVTDNELDEASRGPAPFVNKFFVTMAGTVARIAFTEQKAVGKTRDFRAAVTMSVAEKPLCKDCERLDREGK